MMMENRVILKKIRDTKIAPLNGFDQWRIATWAMLFVLLAVGLLMRLHQLGLPFDRDSYDEGIFWQVLLSMSTGHPLYEQTFCSQPPAFMLSIYPFFLFLGKSIWAARLGIALISMLGLLGAALLGYALAGRNGAIAGLALLLVNPFYLMQSQTLQSDAPSMAFSLLAVALAYWWYKKADQNIGYWFALLAGISLSLSIFTKLTGVCALVPIGMLVIARAWHLLRRPPGTRMRDAYSLLAGVIALIVTSALILLPFIGLSQFWQNTVAMYLALQNVSQNLQQDNFAVMQSVLISFTALAALYGASVALMRHDRHALPIIAWFVATVLVLWAKVPLYHHHLLALIPPLVALAILGIKPIDRQGTPQAQNVNIKTATAYILIAIVVAINSKKVAQYYSHQQMRSVAWLGTRQQVITDLHQAVEANQLVITDAPFLAALADYRTPAPLVDTAFGRIRAGGLTSEQLIRQAKRPQVQAILFYSGRLSLEEVGAFRDWVAQHYQLKQSYSENQELWVKRQN